MGRAGMETPPHIVAIAKLIERIGARQRVRAVVSMPPRHGKTMTFQRAFAWLLKHDPTATMGYITYGDRLARNKSRPARRFAEELGITLDRSSRNVNDWRTPEDGGLISGGVGGPLTGMGINRLLVIDDPHKGRQEAESEIMRERAWDFYLDDAKTRLDTEDASIVIIQTRWHKDDLAGRLLASDEGYEELRLPAIAEEGDPLGRAPGEPLWPGRWSDAHWARLQKEQPPYSWASIYQQRPIPKGDVIFGPAQFYDPAYLARHATTRIRLVAGMDTGYSKKTRADASAVIEAIVWKDPLDPEAVTRAYITRIIHGRMGVTQLAQRIQSEIRAPYIRWRLYGAEQGTAEMFRTQFNLRILAESPQEDKFGYAQPAAAAWNAGRILLPRAAGAEKPDPAITQLIHEVADFTGMEDPHDDQVDALSSLWREVMRALPSEEAARALAG